MRPSVLLAPLCMLASLCQSPASAATDDLPQPKGAVVLTISGKIEHSNGNGTARFDMAMLEALKGRSATMETPWTKGKVTFKGPFGRAVLDAVGAKGTMLKVTALNDYAVDVPEDDLKNHDVIMATELDGKPLSVRDKGPIFFIYPFDKEPTLYNETYFSRSAWQVKSIVVD